MLILKHKISQDTIEITFEELESKPDLKDYEPVEAIDMVEVSKYMGQGMISPYIVTEKAIGERMNSDNPNLYPELEPWENWEFIRHYHFLTLPYEEFLKYDNEDFGDPKSDFED